MIKPILSICIPTYNRAHYLKRALESIAIQVKNNPTLNKRIEVVVSDNASTDRTKETAEQYRENFINFVYVANNHNNGFDTNCLRTIQNATGDYIWFLGDDDIIIDGAVAFMANLVSTHEYEIGGTESLAENPQENKHYTYEFVNNDIITTNSREEFFLNGYCRGALACIIVKRKKMLDLLDTNSYIHLWLYYEAALRVLGNTTQKQFFITAPTVVTGQDCRWAENGSELITFVNSNLLHSRMLHWGFTSGKIKDDVIANSKKLPLILLRAKGHGLPLTLTNLLFMIKNMPTVGKFTLLFSVLLFLIPNPIVVALRDLRKKIKT